MNSVVKQSISSENQISSLTFSGFLKVKQISKLISSLYSMPSTSDVTPDALQAWLSGWPSVKSQINLVITSLRRR